MIRKGFIITSHWHDSPDGLELTFICRDNHGVFTLSYTRQKIVFFIPTDSKFSPTSFDYDRKSTGLKSFNHKKVDTIYLDKYSDIQEAKTYCENNSIRTFEIDVQPTERFLMERFIFGTFEIQITDDDLRNKKYINPQIKASKAYFELSHLSLDIETGPNNELYSIAMSYQHGANTKNIVLMINESDYKENNELIFYRREKDLLENFIRIFNEWDPDLIIGWHVIGFDLMFLERKLTSLHMQFTIGRKNKKIRLDERKGVGFFANIFGRVVLDGPPVLRGAFYQFKNFKLETVASEILGTGKDINSDDGKVSEIQRRFKEDKIALAKYNLLDCTLVTDIFNKLGIFDLLISRVNISGLLLDRLSVSTAAFDHQLLPLLHRKGYVASNRIEMEREESSTGGLVLEPKAGLHNDVAIFDFKSLYPSIIKSFKIDPYSLIMNEKNPIKTPSGHNFSSSEHILPNVISKLLGQRQIAKLENDNSLSQAIKILMNSFYGVMGSTRCRFYHADLPSAITLSGQWVLKSAISFFENHGHEVLYGDTDSIFIKLSPTQLKSKDYCQNLSNEVDIYLTRILKEEFAIDSYLECEYEKSFDKIFFAKARGSDSGAKKKYAGYLNGKIEFKGMESVRSDWTELAKNFQKAIYEKFFQNDELEIFIKDYIQKLEDGEFDEKLVYTKKLSKAPQEYTKNIPIHVKAALQVDHRGPYRLKEVSYVITPAGPVPIQLNPNKFDYKHYIEKQLKPVADDILGTINKSFDSIYTGEQLEFF